MADPARLLADEEEAWRRLHDVVASIPPARLEEPGVTPDGWTPKDVMFHVGAWLATCLDALERIEAGTYDEADEEPETPEVFDRKNRTWFETSRRLSVAEARTQFEAARQQARECFGRLEDPGREAWSWFEESGPLHYAKHAADLEAWLDPRP
jgi:hypothetical protein